MRSPADRRRREAMLADLAWRGAGVAALAGAALSSLAHRAVLAANHHAGVPSVWEAFFGLLSFIAASLGVLLLMHGRRLFRREPARAAHRDRSWREAPAFPADDRQLAASMLAARAIERAEAARRTPA